MGKKKRAQEEAAAAAASDDEPEGADQQPAGPQACGLCNVTVLDGEAHLSCFCTVCKKVALHTSCAIEHIERCVKADTRAGGVMKQEMKAVLMMAPQKPQELIASNGRPQKWPSLRVCGCCKEGVMEHAEVVKARKAPKAPLPALTRAPPPPKPAAPKPSLPKKTATVQTAVPRRPVVWEAPERPVDRLRGGGGGGGAETFAAEQERLAREAKAEAARLRKEGAERRAAHEAEAASPSRLSRPPSGSGASYGVGTPQGLSRAASASAHGSTAAATPADDPYAFGAGSFGSFGAGGGAAADPFSRLPAPMPYTAAASPSPAVPFTGAAGGEAGGAAPHELPAWLQLDVPAAPAAPAADWGAVPTSAAHDASGGGGGGVTWLEPVYDGRDGAPEEEIDDLLSLLGIAG